MDVAGMRRSLSHAFRTAGLDTPELDARVLVGHALALDHAALAAAAARPLSSQEMADIDALARRRLAGEPVARIVGWKEFWGLPIRLGSATLVPRPETETVVEAALACIDAQGLRQGPLRIADLGTGSGALLVALLSELPQAFAAATDIDTSALAVARDNCVALGFGARAGFVKCHFGAALRGGFDLVVANPPYVRTGDIAALAPEVLNHDPRVALDGGPDGLAAYAALARDAVRLLSPTATSSSSLGAGMAAEVGALLSASGLAPLPPRSDLAGIARARLFAARNACDHVCELPKKDLEYGERTTTLRIKIDRRRGCVAATEARSLRLVRGPRHKEAKAVRSVTALGFSGERVQARGGRAG